MKNRPPKELIWLTLVSMAALASVVVWFGIRHGVRHESNGASFLGLLVMSGGGVVGAEGLVTLIWSLVSFGASSSAWRWSGIAVGMLALLAPWQFLRVFPYFAAITEKSDFEKACPEQLRLAAKDLVLSAAHKDYAVRWFGGEIPKEEIPSVIRSFIPLAAYVTVDEHGIVIVTDGLGGWRGGYMITPPGSNFVPPKSRRITDGFYYVTSTGGT